MAAVSRCGISLKYAHPSLQDDLEVKLVEARHTSATNALKVVRQLKKLPNWQEEEKLLNRAGELTAAFPDSVSELSPSALPPKVHNTLTRLVEQMLKQAYHPKAKRHKRDRDTYEKFMIDLPEHVMVEACGEIGV